MSRFKFSSLAFPFKGILKFFVGSYFGNNESENVIGSGYGNDSARNHTLRTNNIIGVCRSRQPFVERLENVLSFHLES